MQDRFTSKNLFFLSDFMTLLFGEGSSNVISNESQLKIKTYNGEFDPGSG